MSQLVPFSFEALPVRVVLLDGTPLFSARDVAVALGYADPSQAYQLHCKSLKKLSSVECTELNWINPNPRGEYVMPESDVYRLIVKSEKPEAERFEKWVFEEVLPSIRKTGSYSIHVSPPEPPFVALPIENGMRVFTTADIFARNVLKLVGNQALLSANQATYKALGVDVLDHFDQKALPADKRGKTFTQTELGRCFFNLPINARQMGILLNVAGLQNRMDDHWEPTEKAAGLYEWLDTGKWHHSGTPVKQLKWFKQVIDHPDFVTALLPRNTINKRINE